MLEMSHLRQQFGMAHIEVPERRGSDTHEANRNGKGPKKDRRLSSPDTEDYLDHLRFMFAVGIECSNPVIAGGERVDQLALTGHYENWQTDLQLVRELGLRYLRYGPPIHRVFVGPGKFDWTWLDPVMAEMQKLGIRPIIDLVHFGLPDWMGTFQNPDWPRHLSEYASAFAQRYPWVRFYT